MSRVWLPTAMLLMVALYHLGAQKFKVQVFGLNSRFTFLERRESGRPPACMLLMVALYHKGLGFRFLGHIPGLRFQGTQSLVDQLHARKGHVAPLGGTEVCGFMLHAVSFLGPTLVSLNRERTKAFTGRPGGACRRAAETARLETSHCPQGPKRRLRV
jgi:hypothetical protein